MYTIKLQTVVLVLLLFTFAYLTTFCFLVKSLRRPLSELSFVVGNDDDPAFHYLCGCNLCARISFKVSSTNTTGAALVHFNFIDTPKGLQDGWYDAVLLGENGVFASPISTNPSNKMNSIQVNKSGWYRLSISPSHPSTELALATAQFQESIGPDAPCPLLLQSQLGSGKRKNEDMFPSIHISVENEDYENEYNPFWKVSSDCDYKLYFDSNDKLFPICHHSKNKDASKSSQSLAANTPRTYFLGDSHVHEMFAVMDKYRPDLQITKGWNISQTYHGDGIYHNLSPDDHYEEYVKGNVKNEFVLGKMLTRLRNGEYEELQREKKYNIWMFESGHWDLRDVSLEVYLEHVIELLDEFVKFREKFKDTDAALKLVWIGYPAYSFKRHRFGGMEKRTNVKLFKATHLTAKEAKRRDIEVFPFFDITYPLFRESCDTHHFLCRRQASLSPIGYEILKLVLKVGGNAELSNQFDWYNLYWSTWLLHFFTPKFMHDSWSCFLK